MPKRILEGRVVSDKANKTVSVLVERKTMHPIYKKYVKKSRKYAAHDEANMFRVGDVVRIQEMTPVSKTKAFTVISEAPADRKPREFKQAEVATPAKKAPASKKPAAETKAKAEKSAEAKEAAKKAPAKKPAAKKETANKTEDKK